MANRPSIAVSSCLLGHNVRYDGSNRHCRIVTDILASQMEFIPQCPEVGLGINSPRPTIGLYQYKQTLRLLRNPDYYDFTDAMDQYARVSLQKLSKIDGYIFKKGSPSCGPWQVPVYQMGKPDPVGQSAGRYAAAFKQTYPWIPVTTEVSLQNRDILENFTLRVQTLYRWHQSEPIDLGTLRQFHSDYTKQLPLNELHRTQLNTLVEQATRETLTSIRAVYLQRLMDALAPE